MPGASDATQRVTHLNANWSPSGGFELMVVTEDDERHTAPASAEELTAISTAVAGGAVLLWDPEGATMVLCNLVGEWVPQDWSSATRRTP